MGFGPNGSQPYYQGQYRGLPPTRLQALRLSAGLKTRELGEALGVSGSSVSSYELGQKPIPEWHREKWAAALGITVEQLMQES